MSFSDKFTVEKIESIFKKANEVIDTAHERGDISELDRRMIRLMIRRGRKSLRDSKEQYTIVVLDNEGSDEM